MDDTALLETKRMKAPEAPGALARPTDPAPSKDAPLEERKAWSTRFVRWFMSRTGGEWPDPPEASDGNAGSLLGRRWRDEFFACVSDPQAFEAFAEQEIETYSKNGGR
jgi:hypothetical protein